MSSADDAGSSVRVGDIVDGKYRIVRQIGQGGMGSVYEAENITLGRSLALKVLEPHLARSAALVERFMREARAAATVTHPNVVYVFDVGWLQDGRLPYIAMELLDGQSLASAVKAGGLQVARAAAIAAQILDALEAAHAKGIIHRDLKPANVFLLRGDVVKVLDFGISKMVGASDKLTATGSVLGTPSYMSPEQARGARAVDHRTDLYGVGAILYEMLSGTAPYEGDSYNEILFKIATESPQPIASVRPDVPEAVANLLDRSLRRNPAERFSTAREMRDALIAVIGAAPLPGMAPGASRILAPAGRPGATVAPTPAAWELTPASGPPTDPTPADGSAAEWPAATGAPGTTDPRSIARTQPSGARTFVPRPRLPSAVIAGGISVVAGLAILGAIALWSSAGSEPRAATTGPPSPPLIPPSVPARRPLAEPPASSVATSPVADCRFRVSVAPAEATVTLDGVLDATEIDRPAACGSRARLVAEAAGHRRIEREIVAGPRVEPPLRMELPRAASPSPRQPRPSARTGRRDAPTAPPVQILEPNPFSR
ncbi:MAG: protein kinase [Deltaproteobacteria bacterium]|nr:protein kinase [Deltaproteobacteria bacterium]